ncbi:CBO0543 family protein [Aquibacillus rhizosphaerae]|uniref:CBO0543 family protein n=1 Tax=Aquibacillus rhizosphaerae TaxID=3051431 RepID=A0ABT7L5D5_9BACI|nr:CBO0543 family protein [Aquibacillus sp. LR5S19]MDL4840410.1 CBO0543 family protein [Aquibacillus sp. LR5S19]
MTEDQSNQLESILKQQDKLVKMWLEYWKDYSTWETWQFWAIVFMLIIPLIIVIFAIDKSKAFHIGFYGFNIHTWFTYSDAIAMRTSYVTYPFQAIPIMPVNFALDASLVPVAFMLLYQWCLNRNKNVFFYGVILSGIFSFIVKPLLVSVDIIQLNKGMNYFYLFLNYLLILVLSIIITKLFKYLRKKRKTFLHSNAH